jgi:hypothetical protein
MKSEEEDLFNLRDRSLDVFKSYQVGRLDKIEKSFEGRPGEESTVTLRHSIVYNRF